MRCFVVLSLSLFVGLAFASPIGQVEVTTTLPLRTDLDLADSAATTVVVEVFADETVTSASVTERARQAPEDESNEDNEEEDATTVAPVRGSESSPQRIRPTTAIPQPLANSSNFLAEYQFSQQFALGPKDETLPLAGVQPVAPVPEIGQTVVAPAAVPQAGSLPEQPIAAVVPAETAPASTVPAAQPLSGAASNATSPTVVAAGEDEDDAESEEDPNATDAPAAAARRQQQIAVEAQRIEESDSDNEITSDDATTVKSFADEYVYTVQQLGEKRVSS